MQSCEGFEGVAGCHVDVGWGGVRVEDLGHGGGRLHGAWLV